ncbi:MAG: hypothetical protein INR71_11075 [Terriglobus roseus]|nr:hypothetical protein [Terriglobus roseus]
MTHAPDFKRYQLSTLVNNILQTARPEPFEFLADGRFLRGTLDAHLTATGASADTV